jgi:hypothetical protein
MFKRLATTFTCPAACALLVLSVASAVQAQSEPPATAADAAPASAPPTVAEPSHEPPAPARSTAVQAAPEPAPRFVRFGSNTRLSVGLPSGEAFKGTKLSEFASALYKLEGTLDAVFLDRLVLGVRLGVGIASTGDEFSDGCRLDGADTCRTTNVSFGLAGEFLILPRSARFNPWVGIGLSHEVLLLEETYGSISSGAQFSGGVLDFSAGLDFKAGSVGVGPFVNLRTGKYSSTERELTGMPPVRADIHDPTRHNWLMLGARVRF